MENDDHVTLGTRNLWGHETPVLLSSADRRHHVYIVGQSGTGKTTLLRNMILQDIKEGRGVGLIDPHGDLATELLDHIPRHRVEDVVYFNPSDPEYSIGFNPLFRVPKERRPLVASGIVAAFKAVYPESFLPRMEYYFLAAVAAILDCENQSFLGLHRMLSDEKYRRWVVRQIKNPVIRAIWEREFEPRDKKTKEEILSPILNKVGVMLMAPQLQNILGQVRGRIDARFMMDTGRVFIANLSKGMLGEDKAMLIGSFLVAQFHLAALSRANLPESERRDFFLHVDEFQSFVSNSFASMLSESRKYRLGLALSHQYLAQVKSNIAAAVIGNVGSIIAFRVGHEDAEALEKAFGNSYAAPAFTSLNNGEIYAKVLTNGCDIEPFHAKTCPPSRSRRSHASTIILRSREKYGTIREIVERKIDLWIQRPLNQRKE